MDTVQNVKIIQLNTTKAGLQGVDKEYVNKVIEEVSKGTPYYEHQQKRQRRIDKKIEAMLVELGNLSPAEIRAEEAKMDSMAEKMEKRRDLSRVIVHVDMDAFYAAVEMRDNSSLRDKPMAVGSMGMLSTSNYEARKFGVRAAMPGFIGKKLCPSLVIVRPNFDKYTAVSEQIRAVLSCYDPDFVPVSLDEAYLDITDHVVERLQKHDVPDDVVEETVKQMRREIFEATELTASAGIAPNTFLAKVCSDVRKPNDQFRLIGDKGTVKAFVQDLPIRKVPGIGAVQEQLLQALGVGTCGDLWEKRGLVRHFFSPSCAEFYLRVSLGLGCTTVKCDASQKSKSVEETFAEVSSPIDLSGKCTELCERLCEQLAGEKVSGKVVTLKLKTVSFDVTTRNATLECPTRELQPILQTALRLLRNEIAARHPDRLRLRLMGVRLANLMEDNPQRPASQPTLSHFLSRKPDFVCPICQRNLETSDVNDISAHIDVCLGEPRSGQDAQQTCGELRSDCSAGASTESNSLPPSDASDEARGSQTPILCPVCEFPIREVDPSKINEHIDTCLNKPAIKEMLSQDFTSPSLSEKRKTQSARSQRSQKKLKQSPSSCNTITRYVTGFTKSTESSQT